MAECLELLAYIGAAQDKMVYAAQLLGAAESLRKSANAPMAPYEREEYERVTQIVGRRPGKVKWTAARAQGESLSTEQAIALGLQWSLSTTG